MEKKSSTKQISKPKTLKAKNGNEILKKTNWLPHFLSQNFTCSNQFLLITIFIHLEF